MISEDTCKICSAIVDGIVEKKYIWNSQLYETNNFVVMPTIGPFVVGHCMIVSKPHFLSLFSMPHDFQQEFLEIIEYAKSIYRKDLLFVEHGSYNKQTGGSCIEHTHIHILPTMGKYYNLLDGILPIKESLKDFFTKKINPVIDFPYILSFNNQKQFRLYEAYNAHSQMMRKALCTKLNRNDWDWRKYKNIDTIIKSIEIWREN